MERQGSGAGPLARPRWLSWKTCPFCVASTSQSEDNILPSSLDTGSYELWVNPNCFTAALFHESDADKISGIGVLHPSEYCKSVGRYDPASSPTAKYLNERAFLSYADNSTAGIYLYTDNLGIGALDILEQHFGIAKASNFMALGVLGMGPNPDYGSDTTLLPHNLILDSMVSQGLVASRTFSLDLRSYDDATGSIKFGGLNVKNFLGSLQTLPLESLQISTDAYDDAGNIKKRTACGQVTTDIICSGCPAVNWQVLLGYCVTMQSLAMTEPDQHSLIAAQARS